jgi:transmembrane sensor
MNKNINISNNSSDERLDRVLELMNRRERLTADEAAWLSKQPECRQDVDDVLLMEQATMEAYSPQAPDVDAAWQRFSDKFSVEHPRRISRWLWAAVGTAAVVCLVVGFFRYFSRPARPQLQGDVVLTADESVQRVSLTNADGDEIDMTDRTALGKMGANVSGKGTMTLSAKASDLPQVLTLRIPRGKMFKLTLSDGTEVWINNDTRLTYPSQFTGKTRHVWLQGEAYFKVHHDARHPFVVSAGNVQTTVLGTEFNVRAHDAADTHVTLISGRVAVSSKSGAQTRLTPGKDASLQANGNLAVKDVDVDSYLYWRDGYFYFDGASLESIMEELGRWYNMNVVFRNEQAKSLEMHFICGRKDGIDRAVKLLNMMGKARVERRGDTLYIY